MDLKGSTWAEAIKQERMTKWIRGKLAQAAYRPPVILDVELDGSIANLLRQRMRSIMSKPECLNVRAMYHAMHM